MKQPFKTISLLISASTLAACSTSPHYAAYDNEPDYYTYVDAFTCYSISDYDKNRPLGLIAEIEPADDEGVFNYAAIIFDDKEDDAIHVRQGLLRLWYWGYDEEIDRPKFGFALLSSGYGEYYWNNGDKFEQVGGMYKCEPNADLEIEYSDAMDRSYDEQDKLRKLGPAPDYTIDDSKLSM